MPSHSFDPNKPNSWKPEDYSEKIVPNDWDVQAFDLLSDSGVLVDLAEAFEGTDWSVVGRNETLAKAERVKQRYAAERAEQVQRWKSEMERRYPDLLPEIDPEDPYMFNTWDGTT